MAHIKSQCSEVDEPELVIQSEVSQKVKNEYHILMSIYGI